MSDNKFVSEALIDKLLTANHNGWKLDLFVSIDTDYVCPQCQNICKNAVSLVCETENGQDEHKDEDIKLYCETCLKTIISNNSSKCPISGHLNPRYEISRHPRRKIMKSHVLCPNSLQYQQKMNEAVNLGNNKNENNNNFETGNFYSTNEGIAHKSKNTSDQGCGFEGTLGALVDEHIHGCIKNQLLLAKENSNNNSSNMRLYMIEDLQEKNIQMKKDIECLKNDLKNEIMINVENIRNQTQMNEVNIEALKKENNQIKDEMEAMKIDYDSRIMSAVMVKELIQNEMKLNLEKNEKISTINIPLSIHSYRKAFDEVTYGETYHPRNLLQSGNSAVYASAPSDDYADKEKDWVIFEVNDYEIGHQQSYIPMEIKIRNKNGSQAVKSMEVWFGSVNDGAWQKAHSRNAINNVAKQDKNLQSFDLDRFQALTSSICKKKWKQIKVEFIGNYGYNGTAAKFFFYELQLHGKKNG